MVLGVDGNLLCGKKTGMGMVVYHVLKRWKSTQDIKIILYAPGELDKEYVKELKKNDIQVKTFRRCSYPVWEQIVLPRQLKKDCADVLWCPYNTAPILVHCKTVVTVNDVIYMKQSLKSAPTFYKKFGILYRKLIVPKAVKGAEKVITISRYAEMEIVKYFPKIQGKIKVIYLGMDKQVLSENGEKSILEKSGIRKPYILGFGSLEKRKNSMGLIKAYERLDEEIKQEYQLVLFGFRGFEGSDEYKYIHENKLKNVIILGYISEAEKTALYKNSTMFVFPTFSEGFGIPVLEAYASRTPVITSNTTSLPEVAGDAALLINPSDINEICLAIKKVIKENIAEKMVTEGERQLEKFDWDVTATKLMDIMKEYSF